MAKVTEQNFYRESLKILVLIIMAIIGCRFTQGGFAAVIALAGILAAMTDRRGWALGCFLFFPFLTVINPLILPLTGMFAVISRVGMAAMAMVMMITSQRWHGTEVLPLGSLGIYLGCATLSSITGYLPMISYFKLFNFVMFLSVIYFGTRNLHHRPEEVHLLRTILFAFAILVILGSALTLLRPSVAYYVSVATIARASGLEAAQDALRQQVLSRESVSLFCGILNQSQGLAPVLSCLAGWLICDMLMVEKRIRVFHALLLGLVPVLLYLTRSRLGLFAFGVMILMLLFYYKPKIFLSSVLKRRLNLFLYLGFFLMALVAGVMEFRDHALTRWIRKVDVVQDDKRTLGEAITETRMGTIEQGLRDFRKNPLFGKGFQVAWNHPELLKVGWIRWYSAPVEKGFLPTMILGEGGIVGAVAFCLFLVCFWRGCMRKRFFTTWMLFVVYLTTNCAESTFFSPGGIGGPLWMITVVGGFIIDLAAKGKVQLVTPIMVEDEHDDAPVIDEWERRHSR